MPEAKPPTIVIVGGGVAGTLTALQLTRSAKQRSTRLEIVVLDPVDRLGRGTAFGTNDESHLLNVPAAGMSAVPEQPRHFLDWRRRTSPRSADAHEFAPRRDYARYLEETLDAAVAAADCVTLTRLHNRARCLDPRADGIMVGLDSGATLRGDAVVIGTGLHEPGTAWAPDDLRESAFFVSNPWVPDALSAIVRDRTAPPDVLVIGTGLTMVDVALSLSNTRPGRRVHALSRTGKLPEPHARTMALSSIPEVSDWGHDLDSIVKRATRHLEQVEVATGDWRPGVDGLRFRVAALWARLSEPDRLRFLDECSGAWNRRRHRIPPASADHLRSLISGGQLTVSGGRVATADPLPRGGLRVGLTDGTTREVGWVINCTGPAHDVRTARDPLIDDLLRDRYGRSLAVTTTNGMGFATSDGRLLDSAGASSARIWVLGALRRGELFECTAVPEIRSQAVSVATAVLDEVSTLPHGVVVGPVVSGPSDRWHFRSGVSTGRSAGVVSQGPL
jgi:uncharacterized NAD(P)/FAD-binding protein YdhS